MVDFSKHKLGCLPPHPASKSKRVPFTSVFGAKLPTPELERDWTAGETKRPMFGNDDVGDCTCAAIANIIVGAIKESYGKDWNPNTADVLNLYSKITGYDPSRMDPETGNNPTDTGAVIEDVLKYVMKHGAFGHRLVGTASIYTGDSLSIKRSIDWFGCVDLGVSLPLAWQDADKWTTNGYSTMSKRWSPGSWGGHCVCSEKYDPEFLYVWTWGELLPVSWGAVGAYFDTADAIIPASWIKKGMSPASIDLAVLESRMKQFTA